MKESLVYSSDWLGFSPDDLRPLIRYLAKKGIRQQYFLIRLI